MTTLESLPCEMFCEILEHIPRITDLKSLCLVSKTISLLAYPDLYHDMVIPSDLNDSRGIHRTVEALSNNRKLLKFTRRLHVGECSHKTTVAFDRFLAAFPDNSIHRFSHVASKESQFPTVSQTEYICLHQRKIRNLHSGNFLVSISKLPDPIQRDFLNPITDLSFPLSTAANELSMSIPWRWPIKMVKTIHLRKLELSFNLGVSRPRLASVFRICPLPNLTNLSFRECIFEDSEVHLALMPKLEHLVLADCFNISSGLLIANGTTLNSLELSSTDGDMQVDATGRYHDYGVSFEFVDVVSSFRDLEILIIQVSSSEALSQNCVDLADAIRIHNETLSILLILYGNTHVDETPPPHISLMEAIKTCQKLSQLCIEIDPIFMVPEFEDLIQSLPSLEHLYLVYPRLLGHDWETDSASRNVRGLLERAPLSSELSFICFQTKWPWKYIAPTTAIDHSEFYFRPALQEGMGEIKERAVIETSAQLAKSLAHNPGMLTRLEPGLVKDPEPNGWFEA